MEKQDITEPRPHGPNLHDPDAPDEPTGLIRFETRSGSVYYIDYDNYWFCRSTDDTWREYVSVTDVRLGKGVRFFLSSPKGEDRIAYVTTTDVVWAQQVRS